MAHKRIIHAKYKNSPNWFRLTYFQQSLFYGLLLDTDDDGIATLFYSLDHIAPSCEKVSSKKFEEGLRVLEEQRFIHVYKVDEFRYVQFRRWLNDQKIDRYHQTDHPKSEYYLKKTMQLEKSPNRNYYDEQDKPLPNVATLSQQSSDQQELNNNENLNLTSTQQITKTTEEWVGYKVLIQWLKTIENVNSSEALARSIMAKYSKNVILKAMNNSSCASLNDFYSLCTHYSKQQTNGK